MTPEQQAPEKKTRMGRNKKKQAHLEANWGGAREGSGRKIEGKEKKVAVGFSITGTAKAQKEFLQSRGIDVGALVTDALNHAAELLGWQAE